MNKKRSATVALIYDFDGTLSPGNMQEFGFIQAIGKKPESFWNKVGRLSEDNDASGILCYMKEMLKEAKNAGVSLRRESFRAFGSQIKLFKGVVEWFDLINRYGASKGINIVHYINSSGLVEMIEGSPIAHEFKKIYACSYLYDVDGIAEWPAVAVDYTAKTQFLFKINKGIDSISDNKRINEYQPEDQRPVPFKHMIYFGDGDTDIPCMKLVKQLGGNSVAVYQPKGKERAGRLISEQRVNFVCPADYRENKDIYNVVTTIIDKIKSDIEFENLLKNHMKRVKP